MSVKNRRPSIFERLSDPSTFTGVYLERFKSSSGSINSQAPSGNIHSISEILRPNVRSLTTFHIGFGIPGQRRTSGLENDTPSNRFNPYGTSTQSSSSIPLSTKKTEDDIRKYRSFMNSPTSPFKLASPATPRSTPTKRRPSSAVQSRESRKLFDLDHPSPSNTESPKISNISPEPASTESPSSISSTPPYAKQTPKRPSSAKTTRTRRTPLSTSATPILNSESKIQTVFDRLNDQNNFTGVYRERFESGIGAINASSEFYEQEPSPNRAVKRAQSAGRSRNSSNVSSSPSKLSDRYNHSCSYASSFRAGTGSYAERYKLKQKEK